MLDYNEINKSDILKFHIRKIISKKIYYNLFNHNLQKNRKYFTPPPRINLHTSFLHAQTRLKLLKERLNTSLTLTNPSLQSPSNQRFTTSPTIPPRHPHGYPPHQRNLWATSRERWHVDTIHVTPCYCFVFHSSSSFSGKMGGVVRRVSHPRADPPPGGISFMIPKPTPERAFLLEGLRLRGQA